MAEKYRKLTNSELEQLGIKTSNLKKYDPFISFAKQYYPANAHSMLIVYRSEYNDETYNNSLKYIVVYDENGNELPPIKNTARRCRAEWENLPMVSNNSHGQTDEPMDDVIIHLKSPPVELYVKEND